MAQVIENLPVNAKLWVQTSYGHKERGREGLDNLAANFPRFGLWSIACFSQFGVSMLGQVLCELCTLFLSSWFLPYELWCPGSQAQGT
jgi:hypothetical protein